MNGAGRWVELPADLWPGAIVSANPGAEVDAVAHVVVDDVLPRFCEGAIHAAGDGHDVDHAVGAWPRFGVRVGGVGVVAAVVRNKAPIDGKPAAVDTVVSQAAALACEIAGWIDVE